MVSKERYRVFIIDEHPLFRENMRISFSNLPDIEVCGESEVNEQVLSAIETWPPDVIVIGTSAPSPHGIRLCSAIKQHLPGASVIILTPHLDDEELFQAIQARASAYLSRTITIEELAQTIRRCGQCEYPISDCLVGRPKLVEQVLREYYGLPRERESVMFTLSLSPREIEILNYVAQGYLNKQIAYVLNVSEHTIKNHMTNIRKKLNANTRIQAVLMAAEEGLVIFRDEQK